MEYALASGGHQSGLIVLQIGEVCEVLNAKSVFCVEAFSYILRRLFDISISDVIFLFNALVFFFYLFINFMLKVIRIKFC